MTLRPLLTRPSYFRANLWGYPQASILEALRNAARRHPLWIGTGSSERRCVAYPDTASGLNEFEYETFDVRAKGVTTSLAGLDEPVFRLEAWSISS